MAKMMKHKFSIVICTYNGARTIGKVIDTISNQKNYDKFIDEIVVVDNASTDETKEIVLNKKKNNPDIIYSFESKSGLC
ncbi:MAG TPA: glycosyltransferase [Lachnospiraceae bacterium]|nr:glycosyltransferase [Lachnospiraceae bacterium]